MPAGATRWRLRGQIAHPPAHEESGRPLRRLRPRRACNTPHAKKASAARQNRNMATRNHSQGVAGRGGADGGADGGEGGEGGGEGGGGEGGGSSGGEGGGGKGGGEGGGEGGGGDGGGNGGGV